MGVLTKQIIGVIASLLVLLIVIAWIFPEKINVNPVLKESKTLLKKAKILFEDTPDEKDIPIVTPIGDIPVIELQPPDRQQANPLDSKPIEDTATVIRSYEQAEQDNKQVIEEPENNNRQSEQAIESRTYTLDCWKKDINGNVYNSCEM